MKKAIPPFLLGFSALSFQIILIREFAVHFFGNEITFGLILGAWLFWGGLGSIIAFKIRFSSTKLVFLNHILIFLFTLCLVGLRFSRFFFQALPGEPAGTFTIIITAFVLSFFIAFPLGLLFVFNIHYAKGRLTKVYILESLGSASAGLFINFFFIPFFSNWQMASILGILIAFTYFIFFKKLRSFPLFLASVLLMVGLWFADFPSQKIYWGSLSLIESKDTKYGTLHVLKIEEQISLYSNSVPFYTYPDLASAEELTHFALLYKPDAVNILLIGGGSGEELKQILKYPHTEVDCVEMNPEIIRMSSRFLPEDFSSLFQNPRVQVFYEDGRAFLNRTTKKYDVIILNLPDPAAASINRFYTNEFFLSAKDKLNPKGIFTFSVSSAENYISDEQQDFLSSLYFTLTNVFSAVEIIPGDTNIFLASSILPSLNAEDLIEDILSLDLNNIFVAPEFLRSRLNPLRIFTLKETILSGKKRLNLDLIPISYYYSSVLWSKQFRSFESKLMSWLARLPSFWLLDIPLALFVIVLFVLGFKRKQRAIFTLTPLIVMGLTTLIVEIITILLYQIIHGFFYHKISLLLASFMMGLFIGAIIGR